jgi:hypothetical protein
MSEYQNVRNQDAHQKMFKIGIGHFGVLGIGVSDILVS